MAGENEKDQKHFYCRKDKHYFLTDQWHEEDSGESAAHCPICHSAVVECSYRLANLVKAWPHVTGPASPEAKKRVSMNAYKHGNYSKQFYLLAPALAGKYVECERCEFRSDCEKEYTYCPVRMQPMLKMLQAYLEGNVENLKEISALAQTRVATIFELMISDVFKRGVQLPKVLSEDEDGKTTVLDHVANPLLKRIPEYMAALGFLAEQQMMTPAKKQDQTNTEGFLQSEVNQKVNIEEHLDKQTQAMEAMKQAMERALKRSADDSAMKKFTREQGQGDGNQD